MEAHGFPAEFPTALTSLMSLHIYLLRRAFSPDGAPPPIFIRDKVMYGEDANPWEVFLPNDHWSTEGNWRVTYAYTQLSAHRRIRTSRLAGCGQWRMVDNQHNGQVRHEGVSFGTRRCFRFYPRVRSPHTNRTGLWVMWEHILNPVLTTKWVFCRIGRNDTMTLIGNPIPPPSPPPGPQEEHSAVENPDSN